MLDFLQKLKQRPDNITFDETMEVIKANYDFKPSAFNNGHLINQLGENNGSCKLFAFAKLQELTEQQTLDCFGLYYRIDVLKNPDGIDHQNIRNFINSGWSGIKFENQALTLKNK
jgi:hypothetical protein